ncbi:MAG: copper amine oxidase N-terminal domain-containing protein [Clostridiales Family XIII bacterium]|jgi:hypothetical protein|nr:copper amine oxidase N-terminal domain-containing protein [Clostridiales Family XIII bacterium]
MKRTINRLGLFAAVSLLLLLGAMLPTAAFAEDAETTAVTTAAGDETAAQTAVRSAAITGVVTKFDEELFEADGVVSYSITLDDGKDGVVLQITDLRFVYDQELKTFMSLEDVEVGMQVTAILPENAPLATSMPPQTGAAFGLILNSDADAYKIDVFDADLVSSDGDLKLNIGEGTLIRGADGKEAEAVEPNDELLVFYTVVATSQPAQTTPSLIITLSSAAAETGADSDKPADDTAAPVGYVGLRATAEAKGYTVTWTSNSAPITLTKDDVTATVTIGTDAFTYTHLTRDMQPLDSVDKLDLVTRLVDGKTMVANTFIELLK